MPTDEELLSRQMPHSVEAEQAVLGSILIDSECLPQIVEQLKPDDFYIRQNREAFQTIYTMFSMSQKIDPVTVLNQMRLDGTYQEGVTREYFFQLMDVTPTVTNVMDYVAIVKDRSTLRQIAEAANALNSMVANNEGTSAEVLEAAEQRIYAIRQGKSAQGLHHITSVMHEVYDRLAELASSDSAVPGLSTGLPDVDTVISGLNKSDLILLAARPGMGKTSLALNILLYAGKHSGKACVFFSLEMSREQLAMRLLKNESFVDNKKLTTGSLTDEDWEKVALAASALNHANILIDDNPSLVRCGHERKVPPGGKSGAGGHRLPPADDQRRGQAELLRREPPAGGQRHLPRPEDHGKGAECAGHLPEPAVPCQREPREQASPVERPARIRRHRAGRRHRHVHLPRRLL